MCLKYLNSGLFETIYSGPQPFWVGGAARGGEGMVLRDRNTCMFTQLHLCERQAHNACHLRESGCKHKCLSLTREGLRAQAPTAHATRATSASVHFSCKHLPLMQVGLRMHAHLPATHMARF